MRNAPQGIAESDELTPASRRNSPLVPICLALAFLVLAAFSRWQNVVIRDQMAAQRAAQAAYERDVKIIVKAYWSAFSRADKAAEALSVCKFKEV